MCYPSVKPDQKTFYAILSVFYLYFFSQDQMIEICVIAIDNSEIA